MRARMTQTRRAGAVGRWASLLLPATFCLSACYDESSGGKIDIVTLVAPAEPGEGDVVTLDALGSTDSDSRYLSFSAWYQQPGNLPPIALEQTGRATASFVAPEAGSVLVLVIDAWETRHPEANASEGVTITIGEGAIVAEVQVTPEAPQPGQLVTLSSTSSYDPEQRPLSFGPWIQAAGDTVTVTLTQTIPGEATFVAPASPTALHFSEELWVTELPTKRAVAEATVRIGPAPGPTYTADIAPIIDGKCQGCHSFTPPPLGTYPQVAAVAANGTLASSLDCVSGSSPKCMSDKVTASEAALILQWIDDGYPKN